MHWVYWHTLVDSPNKPRGSRACSKDATVGQSGVMQQTYMAPVASHNAHTTHTYYSHDLREVVVLVPVQPGIGDGEEEHESGEGLRWSLGDSHTASQDCFTPAHKEEEQCGTTFQ